MKTIQVFFEIGHFVTTLKSSLEQVKRSITENEKKVATLETQDVMVLQAISHLKQQLDGLDARLGRIENAVFSTRMSTHQSNKSIQIEASKSE